MKILVTGGSGFVGKRLIERLARDGHEILALARTDRAAAEITRVTDGERCQPSRALSACAARTATRFPSNATTKDGGAAGGF